MNQPDKTFTTITEAIKRIILKELQYHIYPNGNEVDNTIEQPNFYTKFIMIAPCIEFLGACYDEMDFDSTRLDHDKIVERRFNTALKKIFPKSYLPFSKSKATYSLYRFYRCAILHQLRPGEGIALTTRKDASENKQVHLQITVNKELILVIEDLFDDLKKAAQKVIDGYENGSITNKKGVLPFIQSSVLDKLVTSIYSIANSTAWGIYHLNQYYFEINTNQTKAYYGVSDKGDISIEAQQKIQREHFPAIMHEFIHYIHEVSTIQGIFTLNLDTLNKSIFSHHMDTDLNSSLYMGMVSSEFIPKFAKSHVSMQGILGSIDVKEDSESRPGKGVFLKLLHCDEVQEIEINTPYYDDFVTKKMPFPKIKYRFHKNNKYYEDYLILGKFYLYEGIAYELDREYERLVKGLEEIDDKHANSEYTVIRDIARDILPDINTYNFLVIASASLSQRNCGEAYVRLLKQYKEELNNSPKEEALQNIKDKYIDVLNQMKDGVKAQLEEIARS
ncbi:MAG: hypothetical protein A3K10_10580 [Bacteroidetes bacterium RIFCSPLOWO2_12_FULL_31_6]|nr:MAG: hypothetical protein A3K10_10580 [Bacteroidetes bacterium RIFCSPLOWO2_12_FULL_31_6]